MTIVNFIILLSGFGVWLISDAWFSIVVWFKKPTPTDNPAHDMLIRLIRGFIGIALVYLAWVFGNNVIPV